MEFAYGEGSIVLNENRFHHYTIVETKQNLKLDVLEDEALVEQLAYEALSRKILEKTPRHVAILVEDGTRKNDEYKKILAVLIQWLNNLSVESIDLVIAYGTHEKHTINQCERLYGAENLKKVRLIHHDSKDWDSLIEIGQYNGYPVGINKSVVMADFRIVIGSIKPHTFAGFTGGRKMILPGVADYDSIRRNHALVKKAKTSMGILEGNPIHVGMSEIAGMIQVDMAYQLVKNNRGHLVKICSGNLREAFNKGVACSKELLSTSLKESYDVVVASIGGAPKDNSLYQSQRGITTAVNACKKDGIVFIISSLDGGVGNDLYELWLKKPYQSVLELPEEAIDIGVHSAYLTAKNFSNCHRIYLMSNQSEGFANTYNFGYVKDVMDISRIIKERYGDVYKALFIENASDVLWGNYEE